MANDENLFQITNDTLLTSFKPTDYTDVGQGQLLARAYKHRLCHCQGVGWLFYENGVWTQSDLAAQEFSQKLTTLQFQEAATDRLVHLKNGSSSPTDSDEYLNYARSRRSSARIAATLKEAAPSLHIDINALDADPLILNTPSGEVHLETGALVPHDPEHYITHITRVSPSDEGYERWNEFLLQISCGDETVADFLQQFAGMAAIGKVYEERLVIAIGSGGNGKSTFFNAIQDVLGDYACTIRSELMIASNDSGKKFEFARLRGKRFAVAEELEEGKQLDTAAIKHLCSTGDINAQFKGKDVFTFKPSHSTVLCTNHMPSVKAVDNGTWDRLIVIPFNGRFRNQATEIKNYGAYLVENCGGAILNWIIAGAQKYIQNDYKLLLPEVIKTVTKEYQAENDWAADFFSTCLNFGPDLTATASELYSAYTTYCQRNHIAPLPQTKVMPRIAEHYGVTKKRTNRGFLYTGVGLSKPESLILLDIRAGECIEDSKDTDWDDAFELLELPTPPAQQNSQPS